ncbi:MAG: hypothetical protein JRI59_05210, partial [Deltaproteobacteria bacterium]|nr:hypothetical protein [Deltaproteobacteria bacterium]
YLPWRLFLELNHIRLGTDHILGFYPRQLFEAVPWLLATLAHPRFFGLLWPTAALALVLLGRTLFTSPRLFLALFLGGNFLAILLAYALAPTSPQEFPLYVRATLDRLVLHISPLAALVLGEGMKGLGAPD